MYVAHAVQIFREIRRLLRDDGTLWLNIGDSYAGSGRGGYIGDKSGLQGSTDGQDQSRWARKTQAGLHESAVDAGVIGRNWVPVPEGIKAKDLVGIPWLVAFALQADGWYLRSDIIWHKPNQMPESVTDRCTKAHEYIFLLSKSERYYYDQDAIAEPCVRGDCGSSFTSEYDLETKPNVGRKPRRRSVPAGKHSTQHPQSAGRRIVERVAEARANGADHDSPFGDTRNKRSVWTVATQPFPGAHFAVFPPKLIEPCILAGCPEGGTVLDPFLGSGTTAKVAQSLGRQCIGIELNSTYCALASKRFRQRLLV